MNKQFRSVLSLLVVCLLFMQAGESQTAPVVTIAVPEITKAFVMGKSIPIPVLITNHGPVRLALTVAPGVGIEGGDFYVSLETRDGQHVKTWAEWHSAIASNRSDVEFGSFAALVLGPRETVTRVLDLSRKFKIDQPGSYSLSIRFHDPVTKVETVYGPVSVQIVRAAG